MSEIIGSELGLESVGRMPELRAHHTSVRDDDIKGATVFDKAIRTGADAGKVGQIEASLEAAATRLRRVADGRRRMLGLGEIAGRADHIRAASGERASSLDPKPGGDAGDERALSMKIDLRQELHPSVMENRIDLSFCAPSSHSCRSAGGHDAAFCAILEP